jgi:hypothetical protein
MAYIKNPSDSGQSWRESAANDSAIRWHGFDNKNNGKDKFFKADVLPNDPNVIIPEGSQASNGDRFLAGVYGETPKVSDNSFSFPETWDQTTETFDTTDLTFDATSSSM